MHDMAGVQDHTFQSDQDMQLRGTHQPCSVSASQNDSNLIEIRDLKEPLIRLLEMSA